MGEQIKQSFQKIGAFWKGLATKTKRVICIGGIGLLAFAVALTLFLNKQAHLWIPLYQNLDRTEAVEIYGLVQDLGVEVQMDPDGQIMVRPEQQDYIIGQMALKNLPKTAPPYTRFTGSAGLTTTDYEKKVLWVQEQQERLQSTINAYEGVRPQTIVTLNLAQETGRVWETQTPKSSGSVSIFLEPGYELTPAQVSAIQFLVSSSLPNMNKEDVQIIDGNTKMSLRSLEDVDLSGEDDLNRLKFERMIEEKMEQKAYNLFTMVYPPDQVRVSATVKLDYDRMVTESKQYSPSDMSTNNSGVLQHEDSAATTRNQNTAQGIPGEDPNTDVPTYENLTGTDSNITDSSHSADYAVSYILQQIEKDKAELESGSIAVMLATPDINAVDPATTQSLIESVAKATNLTTDNVSVQFIAVATPEPTATPVISDALLSPTMILILAGAGLLLLLLLIILLVVLRRRSAKKKQEELVAEQVEEQVAEEVENTSDFDLQQELEERKRQLLENAQVASADEAITEEVREFARDNPEITANLLRAWMKEEIE